MLRALRSTTGEFVYAPDQTKSDGPFLYPACGSAVALRKGKTTVHHFGHKPNPACGFGTGETETHRRCKTEIYEALLHHPGVTDVELERNLTTARPDVSARIGGVRVAIEVQISNLSLETIIRRTEEYTRRGIYVVWLLQWTPLLDRTLYSPRFWERWIHAAYG